MARIETLDCGHEPGKGTPVTVNGKTVMGWQFVLDFDGRKICHACADKRILDCGHTPSPHGPMTTGYGTDSDGKRHCFACCSERERAQMVATGKATLYLSKTDSGAWQIADWPGLLKFTPRYGVATGRHNWAGKRYSTQFVGPDGFVWSGVTYGDNTQIHHCKRTKQRA